MNGPEKKPGNIKMPTFAVNVEVDEIVDGFETIIEEVKTRYLAYVILGVLLLLFAITVAAFLGAMCALLCYHNICRRLSRRRRSSYDEDDTSVGLVADDDDNIDGVAVKT